MKFWSILLVILVLVACQKATPSDAMAQAAKDFYTAIYAWDENAAIKVVTPESTNEALLGIALMEQSNITGKVLTVDSVDKATGTVRLTVSTTIGGETKIEQKNVPVVNINGKWLVDLIAE